ncbi:MAG: valS [Rickettsiales bacterium]|jgi:valyl-tRNA synthetase|nr:valS [Rickettsiales bacterium]
MKPLPAQYNHSETEKKWQKEWEEAKVFAWDANESRENSYVIDTPPPTVSGLLHMGHIFSYTQADFVARFQRMSGKNVFYPMGFDDNGLPTERLVEKVKKVRPTDMSREEFTALCDGVAEEARKEFRALFESVALSVDWDQEYHTISNDSQKISQLSFIDLFRKEKAYRKLQPMLWDPVDQTAIAQAEVEDKEHASFMNHIHFGVEGSNDLVTIATTRPELLAACVAVFYHPDDTRYQHLKGKTAITALFGVKVPFLADENVKMEKGTGLVMCCTFGDETDIVWWREHKLTTRILLNKYGKIAYEASEIQVEYLAPTEGSALTSKNTVNLVQAIEYLEKIKNQKSITARETTIELLKEAGLLIKQEPITHAVKCAERSGAPLEILPTTQWFIKIIDQKAELKEKAAQCNWYPEYMKVRVDQWIDGLSWDWCISRQRYFGVPFPIWYSKRTGEEGKILLAEADQLPVNPLVDLPKGYARDEVTPEADVMDTWATSSVSPQLSSKGITKDYAIDYARHQKLFPADLRPQAHEIIRTWAFYTLAKAHLHENTIPWKNLMISGWCLAADKTKMSKSKGNVVTPVGLIEEKGADVVRYWASTSHLGADTAYSEDVLKIGKKLVNKLWNVSKFASIQLEKLEGKPTTPVKDVASGVITEALDLWVLSRLSRAIAKASQEFVRYEYCRAREAIEDFFWNDFCDNYLEMIKARAYGEAEGITKQQQQSVIYTVYHAVEALLRLFAPIVPHIAEELYSHMFDDRYASQGSIHGRGRWPLASDFPVNENAEAAGIAAVKVLNAIRKLKADKNVSIKWPLEKVVVSGEGIEALKAVVLDLQFVSNAAEIIFGGELAGAESCKTDDNAYSVAAIFAKESDAA